MRNWVVSISIMAAAITLAGFQWLAPATAPGAAVRPAPKPLVNLDSNHITGLEISGPDYLLSVYRAVSRGGDSPPPWQIADVSAVIPEGRVLDTARLDTLLWHVLTLFASQRIPPEASQGDDWGLNRPKWVIKIYDGETAVSLRIGSRLLINDLYYAQINGSEAIYLIPGTLPDTIPDGLAAWFVKTL